jgi:CheY-like chemotaxis protein
MNILLWTDDLLGRVRMESRWKAADANVLRKNTRERPDMIVMDLQARDAMDHIARLHRDYPDVPIIAYGPHVKVDAFDRARAAGAIDCVPLGQVTEKILARL